MKNSKKPLNFWLVFAGLLFLINPTVHLIDVLPDAIGALLIAFGLSKSAYVLESHGEARSAFYKLLALDAVRLVLSVFASEMADMTKLLVVFVYTAAEIIIVVPALLKVFQGFEYISLRYSKDASFEIKSNAARNMSIITFIVKSVFAVLPLTSALFATSNTIVGETEVGYQNFSTVYYFFSVLITLLVALPCTFVLLSFTRRFHKDVTALEAVNELYYGNYANDKGKTVATRMRVSLILIVIASVFTFNPYIDNINLAPNIIPSILIIAAVIFMTDEINLLAVFTVVSSLAWAVLSFISLRMQMAYSAENYTPESAYYGVRRAVGMYRNITVVSTVETALFLITAILFVFYFSRVMSKHTKMLNETIIQKGIAAKNTFIPVAVMLFAVVIVDGLEPFLMPFFTEVILIKAASVLVLSVLTIRAYKSVYDNIYFKLREN